MAESKTGRSSKRNRMPSTRHARIRMTSYTLFIIAALAFSAYQGWDQAAFYRRTLEYDYQRAFYDLCESVTSIDTTLQKGLVSTSPELKAAFAAEIFRESSQAQAALGALPLSSPELVNTARFLSQVGDYSYLLTREAAGGEALSMDDAENILKLSSSAKKLADELSSMEAILGEEQLDVSKLTATGGQTAVGTRSLAESEDVVPLPGDRLKDVETEFQEFATLLYDGPFSAHIEKREAVFLENQAEISLDEARSRAAELLNLPTDVFRLESESGDKIPVYTFAGRVDGGEMSVDITKRGGILVQLLNSRIPNYEKLSTEEAIAQASDFLLTCGFANMTERYWEKNEQILYVNFASVTQDFVCYPDLIKVKIALDTGRILGFESTGYLMNHTERSIPNVSVSHDEARANLSPLLTVESAGLAVVPTNSMKEIFCHEFLCKTEDGKRYLIYVNVETGREEKILLLVESENGTLTI